MNPLFEKIEAEYRAINEYKDVPTEKQAHETVLGELNDYEKQLFTLAELYRRKVKELKATLILLEEEGSDDKLRLENEKIYLTAYHYFIKDLFWLEIRTHFKNEMSTRKEQSLGLCKGHIVVTFEEQKPSFTFKGPFGPFEM